jgi:membrane dipeptidase
MIIDGHNDVLLNLYEGEHREVTSFFQRLQYGHLDYFRMKEANFGGGFFSIFIPPESQISGSTSLPITETAEGYRVPLPPAIDQRYAQTMATEMIEMLKSIVQLSAGKIELVREAKQLQNCLDTQTMATIIHFEGAEPIDPELKLLPYYYDEGLRSIGLVWSRPNAFGYGVPFVFPHSPDIGPGLTEEGRRLVQACNEMGIMIDLAHINEQGFWEVARLSKHPVVVTHTAAHTLCPISRNLTDRQLDAIKDSGGVVGINFAVRTLRADGRPNADTPIAAIVQHFQYVIERIGIEHVAFGSDLDGTTIPAGLKDVTGIPEIIQMLREIGLNEEDLRKLCQENWQRVLIDTWR